jgi:DNA primase
VISRKSIDDVLERARIEEVVQDFVSLKRRGSNLIGLCPFHHEKTPSFSVSPTRNIFKCFGCGKGGDPVKFVMEHESYDFGEAIRYLAGKYGIPLEETKADAESILAEKERETTYQVLDFAWSFFKKQLHESEEGQLNGLTYFQERGFRPKTIETFGLGYAPDRTDALVSEALKMGFTKDILQKAGLMTQGGTDFFRHRVMFPIFNVSGKVIAFAGRQIRTEKKSPKYINSPETDIYVKRKVVYGISQAKKAIRDSNNCYLVEGYTDVISLFQSGVENVVASSGTALTPDQIRLIRRYAGKITVLYDSDPAGVKAAMRGLDLILEENLDVRLALLP